MKEQKASKTDFDISSLPKSRKEQFKDIIVNNTRNFLKIDLALFVFLLPLLVVDYMRAIIINNFNEMFHNEEITIQEFVLVINIGYLINLIFFIGFLIGLAGVFKIYKEMSWQEGILFFHDFKEGIKQNIKGFTKIGLVIYFLYILANNIIIYINIDLIDYFIYAFLLLLVTPSILYMFEFENYYTNTLTQNIKNAFIYSFKNYFISFLFALVFVLTFGINYLSSIIHMGFIIIIVLVLIFVIFPLYLLSFHLYSLSLFDRYINKKKFSEIYKKGLYKNAED